MNLNLVFLNDIVILSIFNQNLFLSIKHDLE